MKLRFFLLVLPITAFMFLLPQAWAESTDDFQVYNLGTIVVSEEKNVNQKVAITNEITAEDIKATNSHTIAEALSHAPGVKVQTGAKNQATVSIHGFDQSKTLFMIDGVPFYETKYGILDLNSISTDNIAKIEIMKGAPSVLYGANTMGGVVNIVTKKPTEKPFTSASFEMSQNETYRTSVSHGMKKGIFSYWLNYMHEKSDGWSLSDDFTPEVGTLTDRHTGSKVVSNMVFEDGGDRINSDYKRQNFWGKFGIEPREGVEYFVNFHYLKGEKGVPSNTVSNSVFSRPVFSRFYADRIPEYDQWGIDLDGRQKLADNLIMKTKLFYHSHKDSLYSYEDPSFTTILAKSHYKDYMAGGTMSFDYKPVSWNVVRLGLNYKADSHKEVADEYLPYDKYFSYTGSIGLENEFTKIRNLSIVFGISYDWFEVTEAKTSSTDSNGDLVSQDDMYEPSDDMINGQIGFNYKLADSTEVFGSIAKKSHFPTLNELYNIVANGDPNLKSEKSINYTLGISRMFGNFLKGDFSIFYYDIDDMIARVGLGSNKKMVNIGEVKKTGFEIGVEAYPMDDLILRADFTYNNAEDKSSNRVSNKVVDVPENIINLSVQYVLPVVKTRINLNGSYMESVYADVAPGTENELDAYFLWNAKISQGFLKYYEFYVAMHNIFDEDYEWGDGYPAEGRNIWTGVSVKF